MGWSDGRLTFSHCLQKQSGIRVPVTGRRLSLVNFSKRLAVVVTALALSEGTVHISAQSGSGDPAPTHVAPASAPINSNEKATSIGPAAVTDDSYRIGIEDELLISVWREPELSGQVVVRPDGVITVPLVNDIKVVGLSTPQLAKVLTDKLRPFVTEPQVTVVVRSIHSRKVFLVGQVARPGELPLNNNMTIMELLAEAGGLSPYAKSKSIYVIRTTKGKSEKLPFNYKDALKGKGKSDFQLQPGDMIVVP